ncbi:hypothetical protein ACFQ14_05350 [Pseudahrensia aquimaris]|uniref:Uncharacterized protein n=1 Tax=Pseudahrensia aquimaris TaxID=744461 RepID=A0ABW3FBK3_9HYPH
MKAFNSPLTTMTRRTMLASTGAATGALAFGSALPIGSAQAFGFVTTPLAAACHHNHTYQISSLMVSMGSPVLSAHEKTALMAHAACPGCGESFSGDLMAEVVCQNVELTCSASVSA